MQDALPGPTRCLTAALLLFAFFAFWKAAPPRDQQSVANAIGPTVADAASVGMDAGSIRGDAAPKPQRRLITRPIRDFRPGMRVLAENPELAGTDVPQRVIDEANTRLVTYRQIKPDGSALFVDTLLPLDDLHVYAWERLHNPAAAAIQHRPLVGTDDEIFLRESVVGHVVDLHMPELGASGPATIIAVSACPKIEPDDGTGRRLVSSVFRHSAANVVDVHTTNSAKSIGATANHPFWSEDRQAFIPAGDLRPGEFLRTADRTRLQVTRITPRRGPPVAVFNLEVDGQHVYNVGPDGVLVHNTYNVLANQAKGIAAQKWVAQQLISLQSRFGGTVIGQGGRLGDVGGHP